METQDKAQFFALYINQRVLYCERDNCLIPVSPIYLQNFHVEKSHLLLTPLDRITDEHAIQVAKILGIYGELPFKHTYKTIKERILSFLAGNMPLSVEPYIISKACDYMRSIGIAIPWNEYTVKEMIEAGWLKLKEV